MFIFLWFLWPTCHIFSKAVWTSFPYLPCLWLFMGFSLLLFMVFHASTILMTGHWSCIWRRGTAKGRKCIGFVCMGHCKSIEIAMNAFTPFHMLWFKTFGTWNLQDEGGKNWYAWYCLRHHYMLWSHNMMPTKYSGKGVDRSFHYSVIT